jgi:hydrogenase maturation protease
MACRKQPRILVVGLGNFILRDDGVGVHAVRSFQRIAPRPCLSIEVGTAVFDAIHLFETADRILAFDAVAAGGTPGSVYVLRPEDVLNAGRHDSLHEMGLIQILQTLHRPPEEVVIIGAEPQIIDWGTELSPALHSAVPLMVSTAHKVIEYFNHSEISLHC